MHRSLTTTLAMTGVVLATAATARADFVVSNAKSGDETASSIVSDEPRVGPGDPGGPRVAAPRPRTRRVKPALVHGFGDEVQLAFACRQIVPHSIKIRYGAGADPGMIVTWSGGDTWARVLAAAIKPLGLHMVRSGSTLTIES